MSCHHMKSKFQLSMPAAFSSRRLPLIRCAAVMILGLTAVLPLANAQRRQMVDPSTLPPPKHAVVPKLSGPVKIDGELDEAVWSKAVVLEPFFQNEGSGGPELEHTQVRVWYDDQALYLGWKCTDADIHATFTNRDSHFWEEECVELFIAPRELTNYFEIEWNPLNGVFDATISVPLGTNGVARRGPSTSGWSYTATNMTNAVKVKGKFNGTSDHDEYWQVEVRLPFADLGESTPKPGAVWRANFYRFNRGKNIPAPPGNEQLAWSPTLLSGFHQPFRFGYLEFGK